MKRVLYLLFMFWVGHAGAQFTLPPKEKARQDSLWRISNEDHKRMMTLLGITSIRPGVNGNDMTAPNAVNYDESKANPFPILPDALTLKNGVTVKNPKDWWEKRRPELVEEFDREMYGRTPAVTPSVKWEVVSITEDKNGNYPITVKKIIGHVDNSGYPQIKVDIRLTLTVPSNSKQAVPVVLEFGWEPPSWWRPQQPNASVTPWTQQALARGWGYASVIATSIQADNGAGLTQGIIGLVNKGEPRKPDDWGALKAWAWGASRVLDFFETEKSVDARRVAVYGHSRYGKATAVAMAYDSRFAAALISSSGEGGVKLHRRNYGEIVENVAGTGEYHWMAGNFIKYAGPLNWNDLPVDAHELIALCAPRPVFISVGDKGDYWVDARGMFMACVAAEPVYSLLGKKGLGTAEYPLIETGLLDGEIAFRQHKEGHVTGPNWPYFLDFAARYFSKLNN